MLCTTFALCALFFVVLLFLKVLIIFGSQQRRCSEVGHPGISESGIWRELPNTPARSCLPGRYLGFLSCALWMQRLTFLAPMSPLALLWLGAIFYIYQERKFCNSSLLHKGMLVVNFKLIKLCYRKFGKTKLLNPSGHVFCCFLASLFPMCTFL